MRKITIIMLIMILFGACSWYKSDEHDRVSGDRVSVLRAHKSLVADPELRDKLIILPAPSPNKAWPQAGGYPNHAMHHLEIRDLDEKKWSVDIGEGNSDENRLNSEPVVGNGKVFTIDSEAQISAFNFNSGKKIWSLNLTPDNEDDGHINGGIAYDKEVLYVTTGFAQIIALNANNGSIIWRKKIEGPLRSPPTIRGGRVFVVTLNNKTYALNAKSGEEIWRHIGISEAESVLGGASPAVDAGIIVVPYSSGQLLALRVDNGRVLWEENLASVRRIDHSSTLGDIRGRPVIDRNIVIAMSHGGQIVAIDLRTGKRIWERNMGGLENPWVAGNYIFLITTDSQIICLSRNDGRVYWVRQLPKYEDPKNLEDLILWKGPLLASDRLIVAGSNGEALSISPYSGKILGFQKMPAEVTIPPVIAKGNLLFLTDTAKLVLYH